MSPSADYYAAAAS